MLEAQVKQLINYYINHVQQLNKKRYANEKNVDDLRKFLEDGIKKLNNLVRTHEFESVTTEVYYFKEQKPQLIKEYVFLELMSPINEALHMGVWYQISILKKWRNDAIWFLEKQQLFYKYMLQKETYNDVLYFRRLAATQNYYCADGLNNDPLSCSSHSFLYAQILAYEQFLTYCNKQLAALKGKPVQIYRSEDTSKITWQAHKVDAIELIYALYYAEAVTVEDGSIQELAQQFEKVFKIDVTQQLYRDYIDIKRRKIDPTRFLTKLAQQLRNKIEEQYR